ncbi:MAG: cytochrome c [Bacteroidia bacterium]|nr:cytochrome c [Bacteroidia bacterium]
MKKYFILIAIVTSGLLLSQCHSSKKAMAVVPKLTFTNDLQAVIVANCSPCHIPPKNGNKKPYDNYANVVKDIDEMIHRIQLNPTDKGFMPFRGKKLSDSTIAVFQQWKSDGLLEK